MKILIGFVSLLLIVEFQITYSTNEAPCDNCPDRCYSTGHHDWVDDAMCLKCAEHKDPDYVDWACDDERIGNACYCYESTCLLCQISEECVSSNASSTSVDDCAKCTDVANKNDIPCNVKDYCMCCDKSFSAGWSFEEKNSEHILSGYVGGSVDEEPYTHRGLGDAVEPSKILSSITSDKPTNSLSTGPSSIPSSPPSTSFMNFPKTMDDMDLSKIGSEDVKDEACEYKNTGKLEYKGDVDGLDYALKWNDDDFIDEAWYPQGICETEFEGQSLLLVSWYGKKDKLNEKPPFDSSSTALPDDPARISFLKVGNSLHHPYVHVLLLDENDEPWYGHAGGLFTRDDKLYVAHTDTGLHYFKYDQIITQNDVTKVVFSDFGCDYGLRQEGALDLKTALEKASMMTNFKFSWCDMPQNENDRVFVGSYVSSGSSYKSRTRFVAEYDASNSFSLTNWWDNGIGTYSAGIGLPDRAQGMTLSSASGTDFLFASTSGSVAHLQAMVLFGKSWTSVVPYEVDGITYIMLLKESDGTVHIHSPLSDGTLSNLCAYNLSDGWTSVVPYKVDGTTYIMLLKESNGIIHIHKALPDGSIGGKLYDYDWSDGFTSVLSYEVKDETYIILLKESDGIIKIHKPLSNGSLGSIKQEYDWSSDYTSVASYEVSGTTYIVLLKESDGIINIHEPLSDGTGKLGYRKHSYNWSSGYTAVVPYKVGGDTYIMFLKESNGVIKIHKPKDDGKLGNVVYEYNWSSGYTSVVSYKVDGIAQIFLLKEETGKVRIHIPIGLHTSNHDYDWSDGYTSLVPYEVNGINYMMLLKNSDGVIKIHKLSDDGSLGSNTHSYDWSNGFTSSVSYEVNGNIYILLLKESNGIIQIHKPENDGKLGSSKHAYAWGSGYTSVVPYEVNGNTYILFLKKSDGTIKIHKPKKNGKLGNAKHQYVWSSSYTSVVPYKVEGITYILFLKKSDGIINIYKPSKNGKLGGQKKSYNWKSGYTSIVPYEFDGNQYIMFLKESTGMVQIHKPSGKKLGSYIHKYYLSDGYTSAVSFGVKGITYIMLLKKSDGIINIHEVNNNAGRLGYYIQAYNEDWAVVKSWLWPYGTEDVHLSSAGSLWGNSEHPCVRYVFRGNLSNYVSDTGLGFADYS